MKGFAGIDIDVYVQYRPFYTQIEKTLFRSIKLIELDINLVEPTTACRMDSSCARPRWQNRILFGLI